MNYEITIPTDMKDALFKHLLTDRSKEQMAIILCGLSRRGKDLRLLARHLIEMPAEAFSHQSAAGLELDQVVQRRVLDLAAREKLSQVDFHTHPGEGQVQFSSIDDRNESELAKFIAKKIPGTLYASVVLNTKSIAARLWKGIGKDAEAIQINPPDLKTGSLLSAARSTPTRIYNGRYDRQARAFGLEFQERLSQLRVGLVGLGGIGSVIAEQLTRLGVKDWVLVDPDVVEETNLNRLLGAEEKDVDEERSKVEVARRNIRRIMPRAKVQALRASLSALRALKALKNCGLLIAATDNNASRLILNALASQFLLQLVHVGVNLERTKDGFSDISGEVVIPALGEWCLLCARVIDPQQASRELASREEREMMIERGYLENAPGPSVYHLNALTASLAVTEIHNLIWPYKPLHRYQIYRELEGDIMSIKVPKRESCRHCGPEGILGFGDLAPMWKPKPGRTLSAFRIPSGFDDIESNQLPGADKDG